MCWFVAPLVAALVFCAPAAASSAQNPSTQYVIRGTVLDTMGAPIAGAIVTAARNERATPSTTLTNQRGEFALVLDDGRYTLRIAADGFAGVAEAIDARAGASEPRTVTLQIAGIHQDVQVDAPAPYRVDGVSSATRTLTALRDVPQSVTVVTRDFIQDQLMTSIADIVRYVPGVAAHQGENNRDQVVIRGNSSSADFFVNGVRDDVQYYRDVYNVDRVEALKGPNAMIFGRGGGGGVINRVIKEPAFQPLRQFTVQAGEYGGRRATLDVEQPLTAATSARLNAMFERSGSYRHGVALDRAGINPTMTIVRGDRTKLTLGYEYLRDTRVADRGMPSFQGRPLDDIDPATFYGNPAESHVRARVHLASAAIEQKVGGAALRNRTLVGEYDRFYQNFVPGGVTADRALVTLTAYNNATNRTNIFNQTDLVYGFSTGPLRHTLLVGTEVGRQSTDNFRNTGFFGASGTSIHVAYDHPTVSVPVEFRQTATDADNHVRALVGAVFAQDQLEVSRRLQVVAGVRADRFDLAYQNNRNGDTLNRLDELISPRAGVVFKPLLPLSIYGSYTVSSLPSAGDQFAALTSVTQQLRPEAFGNSEIGVKWDVTPALWLTTAVYRLNRTNTRATDPNDPTRIVQTGSQRTNGYELGINGRPTPAWSVVLGYAYQDAFVTSATTAARAGARVGQVPHHTFSLWNMYQMHRRAGVGVGIVSRSGMFAAIDDSVVLPGYTRADVAAHVRLGKRTRLQANVDNLFDRRYFVNADSNTNISPGAPRTVRVALTAQLRH